VPGIFGGQGVAWICAGPPLSPRARLLKDLELLQALRRKRFVVRRHAAVLLVEYCADRVRGSTNTIEAVRIRFNMENLPRFFGSSYSYRRSRREVRVLYLRWT